MNNDFQRTTSSQHHALPDQQSSVNQFCATAPLPQRYSLGQSQFPPSSGQVSPGASLDASRISGNTYAVPANNVECLHRPIALRPPMMGFFTSAPMAYSSFYGAPPVARHFLYPQQQPLSQSATLLPFNVRGIPGIPFISSHVDGVLHVSAPDQYHQQIFAVNEGPDGTNSSTAQHISSDVRRSVSSLSHAPSDPQQSPVAQTSQIGSQSRAARLSVESEGIRSSVSSPASVTQLKISNVISLSPGCSSSRLPSTSSSAPLTASDDATPLRTFVDEAGMISCVFCGDGEQLVGTGKDVYKHIWQRHLNVNISKMNAEQQQEIRLVCNEMAVLCKRFSSTKDIDQLIEKMKVYIATLKSSMAQPTNEATTSQQEPLQVVTALEVETSTVDAQHSAASLALRLTPFSGLPSAEQDGEAAADNVAQLDRGRTPTQNENTGANSEPTETDRGSSTTATTSAVPCVGGRHGDVALLAPSKLDFDMEEPILSRFTVRRNEGLPGRVASLDAANIDSPPTKQNTAAAVTAESALPEATRELAQIDGNDAGIAELTKAGGVLKREYALRSTKKKPPSEQSLFGNVMEEQHRASNSQVLNAEADTTTSELLAEDVRREEMAVSPKRKKRLASAKELVALSEAEDAGRQYKGNPKRWSATCALSQTPQQTPSKAAKPDKKPFIINEANSASSVLPKTSEAISSNRRSNTPSIVDLTLSSDDEGASQQSDESSLPDISSVSSPDVVDEGPGSSKDSDTPRTSNAAPTCTGPWKSRIIKIITTPKNRIGNAGPPSAQRRSRGKGPNVTQSPAKKQRMAPAAAASRASSSSRSSSREVDRVDASTRVNHPNEEIPPAATSDRTVDDEAIKNPPDSLCQIPECGMTVKYLQRQSHVIVRHMEIAMFECPYCEVTSKTMKFVRRHVLEAHAGQEQRFDDRRQDYAEEIIQWQARCFDKPQTSAASTTENEARVEDMDSGPPDSIYSPQL